MDAGAYLVEPDSLVGLSTVAAPLNAAITAARIFSQRSTPCPKHYPERMKRKSGLTGSLQPMSPLEEHCSLRKNVTRLFFSIVGHLRCDWKRIFELFGGIHRPKVFFST